jgi:hypothetical protein
MTTTTRRGVLAGAASLPALAVPAAAIGSFSSPIDDPVFAAIERHKATFRKRMEAGSAHFDLSPSDPQNAELVAADEIATDEDTVAAYELADTQPATMAGVLALIDYVDEFNRGKFRLDDDWHSAAYNWPNAASLFPDEDDDLDDPDGECGMAYAVLLNVRAALQAMAVRS